jgi:peptidoglycan/LPS O-acetylase OafA/YrhL
MRGHMNKRNRTIDFLRGIAILSVLIHHIFLMRRLSNQNFFLQKILLFGKGGWIGVDLFFLISGFLISGLIFKEYIEHEKFSPIRFLIRRGFKIYPLYYIGILTGILFYQLFLKQVFPTKDLFAELFFIVNYVNSGNPPLGHLWSLSVEEHFYIFLSIFLFISIKLKKLSFTLFVNTYILFALTGFIFRMINFHEYNGTWWKVFPLSHNRFDSLFFGVLLSYVYSFKRESLTFIIKYSVLIFTISICVISLNFLPGVSWNFKSVFLLSINPVCFGLIMIILFHNKKFDNSMWIIPISSIGRYSYSIYIFHGIIITFVRKELFDRPFLYYALSFSLPILIGIILSKLIEIPFLKTRDKFFPSRSNLLLGAIPSSGSTAHILELKKEVEMIR